MSAVKRFFRSLFTVFSTWSDLYVAETRAGISMIEAAEHDDWRVELKSLVADGEVAEVREMALDLVKLGILPSHLQGMVSHFYRSQGTWIDGRFHRVVGYCPACGNHSLRFNILLGSIECRQEDCPSPKAAALILSDPEVEHIVEVEGERFHVKHPLRERIGDALLTCTLHQQLNELPWGSIDPGRYRVTTAAGSEPTFEVLS